jgi:hypothetical protein
MIGQASLRTAWIVIVLMITSCSGGTEEAKHGTEEFRALVARHAYGAIYAAATPEFRGSISEDAFVRLMASLEQKLGTWKSAAEPQWNVSHGTSGHFVNLTYDSQFANGPAVEQFSWYIDNETAFLAGYHVDSPLQGLPAMRSDDGGQTWYAPQKKAP